MTFQPEDKVRLWRSLSLAPQELLVGSVLSALMTAVEDLDIANEDTFLCDEIRGLLASYEACLAELGTLASESSDSVESLEVSGEYKLEFGQSVGSKKTYSCDGLLTRLKQLLDPANALGGTTSNTFGMSRVRPN